MQGKEEDGQKVGGEREKGRRARGWEEGGGEREERRETQSPYLAEQLSMCHKKSLNQLSGQLQGTTVTIYTHVHVHVVILVKQRQQCMDLKLLLEE